MLTPTADKHGVINTRLPLIHPHVSVWPGAFLRDAKASLPDVRRATTTELTLARSLTERTPLRAVRV